MPSIAIKAHYDGHQIVLDEPFELPANSPLIVMLREDHEHAESSETEWLRAAATSDAFAFLADPAEDIYTLEVGEPLSNEI